MTKFWYLSCVLALVFSTTAQAQKVGEVSSTFRMVGPNDKIVVEAFDDPKVKGVSCHLSRAMTGGLTGAVGLAEDPARFSIACRQTGPIQLGNINKSTNGEEVFNKNQNWLFKELRVTRFYDEKRNVLVYLTWSTKLIDGSPQNSISTVAINAQ